MSSYQLLLGDCRETLKTLPAESVNCVVTSPPYFGLRDYGVDGQIGLESSPAAFIAAMLPVFAEVWRVLRKDGTLWLNMGDSYAGSWGAQSRPQGKTVAMAGRSVSHARAIAGARKVRNNTGTIGKEWNLKPKDIMGMPWRLAFALQDAGWYLRQDIIWSKPNPMPESTRDRCTKAHEYLFLLSKSRRYYFDQKAICEPTSPNTHARLSQSTRDQIGSDRAHGGTKTMKAVGRLDWKTPAGWDTEPNAHGTIHKGGRNGAAERKVYPGTGVGFGRGYDQTPKPRVKNNASFDASMAMMFDTRNKRSVWEIPTAPFKEAHFATYPPALVIPCVLAGSPEGGIVLDPFGGSGTTAGVANALGRDAILCELSPEYAKMVPRRVQQIVANYAHLRQRVLQLVVNQ